MTNHPILSETQGTVALLYAEEGAAVKEDDPILEIEIFKMMIRAVAPYDGILRLKVQLGEFVEDGQLIAVLET